MQRPIGKLEKYAAQSLLVVATTMLSLGLLFGGPGVGAALVISILWLSWRFDNDVGSFLVLAVLLLIMLAVLALLLMLMAVAH